MPILNDAMAGKVALITGAGGGIGLAIAGRLAELGCAIAVVDRDPGSGRAHGEYAEANAAAALVQRGFAAVAIAADLSLRAKAEAAVATTLCRFGRLDVLVNCAGGALTPIERSAATCVSDGDLEVTLGANLLSAIYCCQAAAPALARPGGVIVNVSSVCASHALPSGRYAIYGAAKAAVEQYTRSLAVELGPAGIRVNCVVPGAIASPRVAAQAAERGLVTEESAAAIPLGRLGKPADIAGVVEFLCSDLSGYISGECLTVAGGSTLLLPS